MAVTQFGDCVIPWVPTVPPEDNKDMPPYVKQVRKTETLPAGWQLRKEKRALPCDIISDQNITITLRDGVKIYADIFRPVVKEKVPAILCFSPFGKGGHGFYIYDRSPFRLGIREDATSGLDKFESPDPAEWCNRGYAVVNIDIRGSWESEGNLYIEGNQPGVDAYDALEYIASLDWCTGGTTMAGNSWLATTQWAAAIQHPPSLKCIAPWEGFSDTYRDLVCRGGVPKRDFVSFIVDKTIRGRQKREDLAKTLNDWPLMNPFWEDKALDTSQINIPIYALASYCSGIHVSGTFRAFANANTDKKWLRVHPTQEWYDLFLKESNDDLQKFFDRFLKGVENDWEKTPKVRVSVLTYGARDGPQPLVNLPFSEYPPKSTQYQKLYLTQSKQLTSSKEEKVGSVSYQSDSLKAEPADFKHVFDKPTTLIGHSKAKLWVSCNDTDDLDIFLSLRKVDKHGKILEHINVPWYALPDHVKTQEDVPNSNTIKHLGPSGVLRVSHREQDPQRTSEVIPFHPHTREQKVAPGTVVPVEIGIWPMGITFEPGEGLILRVQGFLDQCVEFPSHIDAKPQNLNKGKHIIHTGPEYDSHLVVPVVPI